MSVEVIADPGTGPEPAPRPATSQVADRVPASVRRRLESVRSRDWRSWAVAAWVVAIAALLRFVKLPFPHSLVFDEVYYANEGQELLDHGVEWRYDQDGTTIGGHADFVVHPPLGKWIIAGGIWFSRTFLGSTPVDGINTISSGSGSWRLASAVVGVLSVLMITRIARRMFRSTVLGAAAGLLMALDGFHFVLSRTAILDIFVMFFVLAAFGCLVLDRDQRRRRWLRQMEEGLDPSRPGAAGRPRFRWSDGIPWWRLGAGVMLGAGCGVKWSVIFFVPVFLALAYWWEVGLRKTVGAAHPWRDTLLDEGGWILAIVALVGVTYLATWTGWFLSDDGWKRHYLADQGSAEPFFFGALYNLWKYHEEVLSFHTGLTSPHTYQSSPWQWLLLGRPVAFWYSDGPNCGADKCAAEILLLGTPILWWSFIPALLATAWFGISRRDWRALPIWAGVAAGILPWFYYDIADHRTMYYFYAIPAEPFLILAVTYVLGCLITGPGVGRYGQGRIQRRLALSADDRRLYGTVAAGTFVVLVGICFWIYYPLYVGDSIPYEDWYRRMLLGNRWV